MAKAEPPKYVPARLISAVLVATCVWFLLRGLGAAVPGMADFFTQKSRAPYVAALASGDAGARTLFERDIKANPNGIDVYAGIAAACAQKERFDLAAEYLDRGLTACKGAPREKRAALFMALSAYYHRSEKSRPQEKTIQAARGALDLEPDSPEVLNAYGYMLAENDVQLSDAVAKTAYALQLLKKEESAPMARLLGMSGPEMQLQAAQIEDSYGWALYKQGKSDAAVSAIQQAISDVPREAMGIGPQTGEIMAELYYHLGAAYRGQKCPDLARQALATALLNQPGHEKARAELDALNRAAPADSGKPSGSSRPPAHSDAPGATNPKPGAATSPGGTQPAARGGKSATTGAQPDKGSGAQAAAGKAAAPAGGAAPGKQP